VTVLWLSALAVFLIAGASAYGAAHIPEVHTELPDVDTRTATVDPSAAQLAAAEQLGADVTWNQFGTPSTVFNLNGNLASGVAGSDAVAAVRSWLDRNKTLFRLSSAADLELVQDSALIGGAGHAVLLGQTYDGLLAAPDGLVTVALTGSAASGWDITYASSSLTGSDEVATDASISSVEAWVQAARAVGENVSTSDVTVVGENDGWTQLEVNGFDELQSVRETAFPIPGQDARAAYQTVVADGEHVGVVTTVDGASGSVLARNNIVDHAADNPAWKVFPASPPLTTLNAYPWNYPSTDTREIWCWSPSFGCDLVVGNTANSADVSLPWDQTDPAGPSTFTTRGQTANDREQWITASNNPPRPAGTLFQPMSATRDYSFPWTNQWFTSGCDPAVLGTVAAPNVGANDISAATVNLFVMHSRMHDWAYELGFTESRWNGQANNFATPPPFLGNDPVTGNAQAGAITGGFPGFGGRDNANMGTRPDGTPSVTNMFLWQPIAGSFYAPCVDGDYDMSVVAHEYGHMIENRMIGKGNVRMGDHAGAMGEAIADLFAMEYQNEHHYVPVGGENRYAVGPYVTGNPTTGIRNFGMNMPMSGPFPQPGKRAEVHGVNLGSYEYDITGQQVHADGEIWSGTNFTLRTLLLNRYPSQGEAVDLACASGARPVDQCPGNRRWMQLYFDAMLLMPTRPSLLDARNAILAADLTRFGGANQDLLWRGFAEEGFGQLATTTTPAGNDDDPIPDFTSPHEDNATVNFEAVSRDTGAAIPATIYPGDYEARVTPIADTDAATTGPNLDATAGFVATHDKRGDGHNLTGFRNKEGKNNDRDGANQNKRGDDNGAGYNFIATAPGYGTVRFRLDDLKPGETRTVKIEFATNVVSSVWGATAGGDGAEHGALIDGTEGTNWDSTGTTDVAGRQVVIALGSSKSFRFANVSALLAPGQNRFTALRAFEILACNAGKDRRNPSCDPANNRGWDRVMSSGPNAFPGGNPRPTAPDMNLRTWDFGNSSGTHVIFRVATNQCTGQPSFQGEQDNDPQFSTDCRVTALTPTGQVALPERDTEVHASELQLLTNKPKVHGADGE
jgi:extracellular elastinolytic metalloproteinase